MDNPESEKLYSEASRHHEKGRLSEAEDCYKSVLKLEPDNFDALFSLGALYHEMGKFDKAIKFSKKALKKEPENALVCFNIGLSYDMQGEYDKSIEYFTLAVDNNPDYATAYFARGNTRMFKRLFREAAEDYQHAIRSGAPYLDARTSLARCLVKTGRFSEALDEYLAYEKLIDEIPAEEQQFTVMAGQDEMGLGKGICFYMLGDDKNAEASLLSVTGPEELRMSALLFLTAIDLMNGRSDRTEKRMEELKSGTPGYTTHEMEILKCPYSRFLFLNERSAPRQDEYRGPMWSDGLVPGLASQALPFIEYCPACGMYHPVEDLIHLQDIPNRIYGDSIPLVVWDDVQPEGFYSDALMQDWPPELEKKLRIRLLWRQNDNHREEPPVEESNYHEHHDNVERLLELVSHDKAPLRLAEFYRELGDFGRCLSILDSIRRNRTDGLSATG